MVNNVGRQPRTYRTLCFLPRQLLDTILFFDIDLRNIWSQRLPGIPRAKADEITEIWTLDSASTETEELGSTTKGYCTPT